MIYREAGQFKTSYAADQALFPIRLDRIGMAAILVTAVALIPLARQRLLPHHGDDPVPGVRAGGDRAQPAHRLCRPDLARHRRLHGGRRLRLLQADHPVPRGQHPARSWWRRACSRRHSASCSACRPCGSRASISSVATLAAQFFLDWCFNRIAWLYNYNASGAIEVPTRTGSGIVLTGPTATPLARYYAVLLIVAADDLGRLQPRARADRPGLDDGARHGHRRRAHGRAPAAHQAPGLRRLVLLLRRRRRADGLPLAGRRRGVELLASTSRSRSCSW